MPLSGLRSASMATLRIELPIANDDGTPVTLDDALSLWNAILRTAAECGWVAEGAHCDFVDVEP